VSGSGVDARAAGALHNVADLVRANAQRSPGALALVHGTGPARIELTWAELDGHVDAVAASLPVELELRVGDRVALAMGNTAGLITTYFAVLRAGLVVVPLNTGSPSNQMAQSLGDADAKAVFCEDATVHVVEEAIAETHRALVDPAGLDALIAGGAAAGPVAALSGGEDLAVLLFTSGTNGRQEGARLSHRVLLANIDPWTPLDPVPLHGEDGDLFLADRRIELVVILRGGP
jgi:long-chain acyl-CoA synthetase